MTITNAGKYADCIGENDLYIFAMGYECRSYYLYDLLQQQFPHIKPTVFVFDDYNDYFHTNEKVTELTRRGIPFFIENYNDSHKVQEKILAAVREYMAQSESVTIHIDYSSMPRSWYCKLPFLLEKTIRRTDNVYFWYTEGEYPASYEEYPSSGIDAFSFFSGKPSLQIENNRIHVVALSYDVVRTQAILSITDPSYLIACYAYNPKREGLLKNLNQANDPILSRSAMIVALHVDDFEFMISKLCDTVNELLPVGDVILIPDGPKPLIFALSLVPDLIGKQGVTCLHITRNGDHFKAVDVTPTETVHGFRIRVD